MMQSHPPPGVLVCPRCDIRNPVGRKQCLNCGAQLVGKGKDVKQLALPPSRTVVPPDVPLSPVPQPYEPRIKGRGKIYYPPHKHEDFLPGRPGVVTIYIVWQIVSLVIGLWASPLFALRITRDDFRDLSTPGGVFNLVFLAFLTLAFLGSLVGLWYMKNWARVVQILFLLLSLILEIALTVTTLNRLTSDDFWSMTVPRLILFAVPLWWFITSHRQFREASSK